MTLLLIIAYAVTLLLAAVDQGIKIWMLNNLQGKPERPFLKIGDWDWIHLHFVQNDGAAFSIFSGSKWFLIGATVLMSVVCLLLMHKLYHRHRWLLITMPLAAGGGLGNLYDRVFRDGLVVDYLDFQFCNFAIFNFADICVTVGVFLMAFCIFFIEKEEPAAKTIRPMRHLTERPVMPDAPTLPDAEQERAAEEHPDA